MFKPSALQKMKEELEAQEKQDYKSALKNKIKDRNDTSSLPKFARVNNRNVIECQICGFSTKDAPTFMSHINTKKHQSAIEQNARMQAQAQAKAEAARKEQMAKSPINAKRPAQNEIAMGVDDLQEDEKTKALKNKKPGPSLVAYDDDEDEEEQVIGPVGPVVEGNYNVMENNESEMKEEQLEKEEEKTGDMIIEKSQAPEGFFDIKREDLQEKRNKIELEQNIKSYKKLMDEINKTGNEDYQEILKEIQVEAEPVKEEEQEMLEKVIKGEEEVIEDAQDYISNLRKRLTSRMKIEPSGGQVEEQKEELNKKKDIQNKMEDEGHEKLGFSWKRRGLF